MLDISERAEDPYSNGTGGLPIGDNAEYISNGLFLFSAYGDGNDGTAGEPYGNAVGGGWGDGDGVSHDYVFAAP